MPPSSKKKRQKGKPPCVVAVPTSVRYEPDETPKRKHHWGLDEPGFFELNGVLVGKCPASMSLPTAESLLRSGVGFSPANWREPRPERIYVVHHGWVYRATGTNPVNLSYHGFPELPERFPPLRQLRAQVLALAVREGPDSEKRVKKWLGL